MRKFLGNLKHIDKPSVKRDARQLGINLVTASAVGGFITHFTNITFIGLVFIVWVGFLGISTWFFGVYKRGQSHG